MAKSKIEWLDGGSVWNPVVGCEKVSQGCKHCYAKTIHDKRHSAFLLGKKMPRQYAVPFESVQMLPDRLEDPLHWKKPQMIFVNSVSDLFHKDVSNLFIMGVFSTMNRARHHTFLILTKRPDRALDFMNNKSWKAISDTWPLPNVWLGVSVEDQATADERIPLLLQTPAAVRWISAEPLLGNIDLRISADNKMTYTAPMLDWVVCGGESGTGARPMNIEWARSLRYQCKTADVPFFMKQLSGEKSRAIKDILLFPPDLQIRDYPHTKK